MTFEDWIPTQPPKFQKNLNRMVMHNKRLIHGHNGYMYLSLDYIFDDSSSYIFVVKEFEEYCKEKKVFANYPVGNSRWTRNPANLHWSNETERDIYA